MNRKPNVQRANQKINRKYKTKKANSDPKFGQKSAQAFNLINQRKKLAKENNNVN